MIKTLPTINQEIKQVILVREDLKRYKISVGKLAAQVAHAAVEATFLVMNKNPRIVNIWRTQGQKKIVLKVRNKEELFLRINRARELGLPAIIIRDAGLTELPPNTVTVGAIGPWFAVEIDKVTGDLPLLRNW